MRISLAMMRSERCPGFRGGAGARDGQGTAPTSRPPSSQPLLEPSLQRCFKSITERVHGGCQSVMLLHTIVLVRREMNAVSAFHSPSPIPRYPNALR